MAQHENIQEPTLDQDEVLSQSSLDEPARQRLIKEVRDHFDSLPRSDLDESDESLRYYVTQIAMPLGIRADDSDVIIQNFRGRLYVRVGAIPEYCMLPGLTWADIGPGMQEGILRWAPNGEHIFNSSANGAQAIMEGWLWRKLNDNFFAPRSRKLWRGKSWRAYGRLLDLFEPLTTDWDSLVAMKFHFWRNTSLYMLEKSTGHSSYHDCDYQVNLLTKELAHLLEPGEQTRDMLRNLAETAIRFDTAVKHSWAQWSLIFHDPVTGRASGFPYKQSRAIELSPTVHGDLFASQLAHEVAEGSTVDIITRPLLRQRGSLMGPRRYDKTMDMQPAHAYIDDFPYEELGRRVDERRAKFVAGQS